MIPLIIIGGVIVAFAALYSQSAQASPASDSSVTPQNDGTGAALLDTKGFRNNNPGNLRYIALFPFNGQIGNDGSGYGVYDTLSNGVRALGKQLDKYYSEGMQSVSAIITTWAPPSENDTTSYISDVSARLAVDPADTLAWPDSKNALVDAVIIHENGSNPIDPNTLDQYLNS